MLSEMLEFCGRYDMLPESGGLVLCAVSGGADSVCMLRLMLEASEKLGFSVAAAHFDHCLRGEESKRDADFTEKLCMEWNVPFFRGSGDVAAFARSEGVGTEEAARRLRYAFLQKTAEELRASKIATAHNADDNAETVIMNLARGSGGAGLSGIPPVRGNIIRPLLWAARSDIVSYLEAGGIGHVEDSTNGEDIYTRNRVRHFIMPLLRELNPRASESILNMSELLRRDEEFLTGEAKKVIDPDGTIDAERLRRLPYPVKSRAVRLIAGRGVTMQQTDSVLRLCEGGKASGSVSITGKTAVYEYGRLRMAEDTASAFEPVTLDAGGTAFIPELSMRVSVCEGEKKIINKSFTTFLFKKESACGTITVRPRKTGDNIKLRSGTKSLKKLFIERKIPRSRREMIPVIACGDKILGVLGVGSDAEAEYDGRGDAVSVVFEEEQHE